MDEMKLNAAQAAAVEEQFSVLRRGAAEIVPEDEVMAKIRKSVATGVPLRMKLGMDPSSPDIHVGHAVVLQKIKQMQDFGHICHLVIGDFTGQIGDPTGKSETRKQLSPTEVAENARTYVEQVTKVLDPDKTIIVHNADWLSKLDFKDVIHLASTITVARMLERDDFSKRYNDNRPIHVHEFFYPLMQAYDSVQLDTDIEFGGTDQKFNLLMGRNLQKEFGKEQQVTVMMPLLEGLDGVQKMSKSLGNYIGIDEAPNDMFGKVMSIPDSLMPKYIELLLSPSPKEADELLCGLADGMVHPRDAKMQLARTLVARFLGTDAAADAERHWETVFQQKGTPTDIPVVQVESGSYSLTQLLTASELAPSNREARRLVEQGGVQVDGTRMDDANVSFEIQAGVTLLVQVGKRRFLRISG